MGGCLGDGTKSDQSDYETNYNMKQVSEDYSTDVPRINLNPPRININAPRININFPSTQRSSSESQRSQGVVSPSSEILNNINLKFDFAWPPLLSEGGLFRHHTTPSMTVTPSTEFRVPVTEVTSQLFFGSFDDATNEENLKKLGITHIISLIGKKHPVEGMQLKQQPMHDCGRTDLKGIIKTLWSFVMDSQKPFNKLFVHCFSGQNRSAAVVITILMKLKSGPKNLREAYRMVKKKRPIVQINEIYARQLTELESELFCVNTMPDNWMSFNAYTKRGMPVFNGEEFTRTPYGSKTRTWSPLSDSFSC